LQAQNTLGGVREIGSKGQEQPESFLEMLFGLWPLMVTLEAKAEGVFKESVDIASLQKVWSSGVQETGSPLGQVWLLSSVVKRLLKHHDFIIQLALFKVR